MRGDPYVCSAKGPFYKALGVDVYTVGKVRASTVFMSFLVHESIKEYLLFVKNGFVVGARTLNVTAAIEATQCYWRDPTIVSLRRLARRDTIANQTGNEHYKLYEMTASDFNSFYGDVMQA